jgi:hypothetical protein
MTKRKLALNTITLSILLSLCGTASADFLYKWKDEDGITHFSERPPAGVENYERVRSSISPGNAPVQYQPPGESDEESDESAEQVAEQSDVDNSARCDNARKNLEALQSFARIRVRDPNGELRFLSEAEVTERRQEYVQILNDLCGGA